MVTQWKDKGWLAMTPDGKVDVDASDRKLTENLDPARGGDRTGKNGTGRESSPMLEQARLRELNARAEKAELESAKMRGDLVDRDGVRRAMEDIAIKVREALIAVPDRLAPQLAAETDALTIHDMLTTSMRDIAKELADSFEREEAKL